MTDREKNNQTELSCAGCSVPASNHRQVLGTYNTHGLRCDHGVLGTRDWCNLPRQFDYVGACVTAQPLFLAFFLLSSWLFLSPLSSNSLLSPLSASYPSHRYRELLHPHVHSLADAALMILSRWLTGLLGGALAVQGALAININVDDPGRCHASKTIYTMKCRNANGLRAL